MNMSLWPCRAGTGGLERGHRESLLRFSEVSFLQGLLFLPGKGLRVSPRCSAGCIRCPDFFGGKLWRNNGEGRGGASDSICKGKHLPKVRCGYLTSRGRRWETDGQELLTP